MATVRRPVGHIWLSWALQRQRKHDISMRAEGMVVAGIAVLHHAVIPLEGEDNAEKEGPFIWLGLQTGLNQGRLTRSKPKRMPRLLMLRRNFYTIKPYWT